ncbi:MAG: helix-turn-helix domain-containing protein [Treponema sp.]
MVTHGNETYYTLTEAQQRMGVSRSFMYRLRREGLIDFIQEGRKVWICGSALDAFFKRHVVDVKPMYRVKER